MTTTRNPQVMKAATKRTRMVQTFALILVAGLATTAVPVVAAPAQAVDIITAASDPESGLNVSGLAPGDTTEWSATVENVSGENVSILSEFLVDPDADQSLLVTDPVLGLRASLDTCSQPWVPGTAGPLDARVFACEATETEVMAMTPLASLLDAPFTLESEVAAGGSVHLRTLVEFPPEAGNEFQALSGGIALVFTATLDPEVIPPPTTQPTDPTTPVDPTVPTPPGGPEPSTPVTLAPPGPNDPPPPGDPAKPKVPFTDIPLPRTGSDMLGLFSVGLALVLAGSILRTAVRRRHVQAATAAPEA